MDLAKNGRLAVALGFVLLFTVYHLPEFFQALWIAAVFKILFLLLAFGVVRLQGYRGYAAYGLPLHKNRVILLAPGILIGIVFYLLPFIASVLLGYESVVKVTTLKTAVQQLPWLLLLTGIPSLAEDILTRGYLFTHLKKVSAYCWVIISALVYLLNHLWRLNDGPAVLSYLFILGLVLGLTVVLTQSLWVTLGIHWGANLAFECSSSFIATKTTVTHNGSTWLLAGSWAVLLLLLLVIKHYRERVRLANVQ